MMFTPFKISLVMCVRASVVIVFIYVFIWLLMVYPRLLPVLLPATMEKVPGIIYILQWTPSYHEPFSFMGKGGETFMRRNCTFINCYVTSNRKLLGDITDFDVLLFHGKDIVLDKSKDMPRKRSPDQIYVFASLESAGYYPVPPNTFDGYFNLTWTYKFDSDIYYGYLAIRNRNGDVIGPSKNVEWMSPKDMLPVNDTIIQKIATKKIAAAWFVSNCEAPSKRQKLVEEIKREMQDYGMFADVYGYCGDKQCPRSSMHECLKLLEMDYYFYFSFENSFAEDYVTEKLLHALKHYAVPVVYGGANYKRFMPDGTYLDATKLEPKQLVRLMFEIVIEPERYHEFFKWHNHYSYHEVEESPDTDPYCKLCESINRMKTEKRSSVVHDLEDWWNPHTEQWNEVYNRLFFLSNSSSTHSHFLLLFISILTILATVLIHN